MFELNPALAVYLHRDPVDFRKSVNGLSAIVEQGLGLDPFAPACFVFGNRRRDKVKLLGWHKNGFWLLYKRLEADRFIWPRTSEAVITLSVEQLHWLLEGIDLAAVRGHPARVFRRAS
ncbi:MAG: IS66 family insertion sequence element accessory protein TnpB [Terriglobales bacterium]